MGIIERRDWMLGLCLLIGMCGGVGAGAAEDVRVIRDVPYLSGANLSDYECERCKLDVYVPDPGVGKEEGGGLQGELRGSVLVWFHGGGLKNGEKDGKIAVGVGERFASEGVIVMSVNYRLSPKVTYPGYVNDAGRAVAWAIAHAKDYGGDGSKVFVSGHSAGGYLTAMVGVSPENVSVLSKGDHPVAGLMPISGQMITHSTVRGERGFSGSRPVIDDAAPSYHVSKDAPPMLLIAGGNDNPARAEENIYFHAALRAMGHEQNAYLEVAGRTHGSIANMIPQKDDAVALAMLEFMREYGGE
jgi:acetyl esterase/lipase